MNSSPRKTSGAYTANLLGNIRSHLAGLQGYDVMALELIQNADDAKAEKIVFDITERGLLVRNSGQFSYCGDLDKECGFLEDGIHKCDYHRIIDVGSGGKLADNENIGRFGIGFVSTYQITDHPEIHSSGLQLTLLPELARWETESVENTSDTSFFLPWANDPNSEVRRALEISHVTQQHISQLAEDFQSVLRKSLLFLRHVRKAEVRRNGDLLLACDLVRGEGSELTVSFTPSDTVEQWYILRTEASDLVDQLYEKHERLKSLRRSNKVSIALRIAPEPLTDGLLYAFLPTEQSSGLPLHINADFFPESDRKAVIFAGHQHEQAWNEMLISAAAREVARDPEALMAVIGHVQLWQLLGRAYEFSTNPINHPSCFVQFWEQLHLTATNSKIVLTQDGSIQCPSGVFLPQKRLDAQQTKVLLEIGGRLGIEELRSFHNAMIKLGAKVLTLERLTELLEVALNPEDAGVRQIDQVQLKDFYELLWSIVEGLLPDESTNSPSSNPFVRRILALPLIVTVDMYVVTISQTHAAPAGLEAERIAELLPKLAIAAPQLSQSSKIHRLIEYLSLKVLVEHIASSLADNSLQILEKDLKDLYTLFEKLDAVKASENDTYQKLRSLPIWLSSRGLVSATQVLLPGNFSDPTGQANLLDTSVLTESTKQFLSHKLGVKTQTIQAFVQTVLPTFFGEDGPVDPTSYPKLIKELSNHPYLVDDTDVLDVLKSLPILPTQDGGWAQPHYSYRRTNALVKVLGDAQHLWVDTTRIPNVPSVHAFMNNLGIRTSPLHRHLAERMVYIGENFKPNDESRRASAETFYTLCEIYPQSKDSSAFQSVIGQLKSSKCFPAIGDSESWHMPGELYAPFTAEAFDSQASILDFRATARLNTDFLKELKITINPETRLVLNHLQHCMDRNVQPHISTYIVLNQRAQASDPEVSTLSGKRCIYVESQNGFVRPNQLYWVPQQLGHYAFAIPSKYDLYRPLFEIIGVKNAPDANDFVDIILDFSGDYYGKSKLGNCPARLVYETCLKNLSFAIENGELSSADLQRLKQAPILLNLLEEFVYPDEILLQDSEWYAGFFNGEIDAALCKPAPELRHFTSELGVLPLSGCADVELCFHDGQLEEENDFTIRLSEKIEILVRLLHDKPTTVRGKVRASLEKVNTVSFSDIRIRASVVIGGDRVESQPANVRAFYGGSQNLLILERPVNERSWVQVLTALFHQLMPEETGAEISKLTLSARPLMSMGLEEAHLELSDAGVPLLQMEVVQTSPEELLSPHLDEIGNTLDVHSESEGEGELQSPDDESLYSPDGKAKNAGENASPGEPNTINSSSSGSLPPQGGGENVQISRRQTGQNSRENTSGSGSTEGPEPSLKPYQAKSRPKYKQQRDQRLLSYVRQDEESTAENTTNESKSEHNLAVEVVARKAVCAYERERGRDPEEMAQTHPGYDIISLSPVSGEERFIEVKGVSGEWNRTGVGLSGFQFRKAQDSGDKYWLYVVEFVEDPDHILVHPIQNPAQKVTSFMFDGNWRDAVAEEKSDPTAWYFPGVRIRHKDMGVGQILEVIQRGNTKMLTIHFDGKEKPTKNVTLNIYRMEILEQEGGNDHS
jgi:Protein NO VEIN, C-terminal